MKTIAQQLNIKDFPFEITDKNGNEIYWEQTDGRWIKSEYDSRGNQTYFEASFDGYSWRREYDGNDNEIYFEDSKGVIRDNRPAETIIVNGFLYRRID